jgi:O-glycosyl hydrolase
VRALQFLTITALLQVWSLLGATHHDHVRVDLRHQTIENFGASDCWSIQKLGAWPDAQKEQLARLLFSTQEGIGLSCWRFNVGAGPDATIVNQLRTAETFEVAEGKYDWSRQASQQWFLEAAKRHGVPQLLAFANSPPARMTRNGLTHTTKGDGSTNLKPGYEAQFARYLADILAHFQTVKKTPFQFVSPVNEPSWEWDKPDQEGSRYGNADIRAVLVAVDAALRARQLDVQIIAPESASLQALHRPVVGLSKEYGTEYGNYLDYLLRDPEISRILHQRVAFHSYNSDRLKNELLQNRETLKSAFAKFPGATLWQSEYCILTGPEGKGGGGRDLSMKTALDVARVMHYDLTLLDVSAWQWWLALSRWDYKDGLIYTDFEKPGDKPSVIPTKLLWTVGNFSRFIRPGMRRVELEGDGHQMNGLMGSAWMNERDGALVLVYLNEGSATEDVSVNVANAAGQPVPKMAGVVPFVTSDRPGDDLKEYPFVPVDAAGNLAYAVPPQSAVTLVVRGAGGLHAKR